MLCYLFKVYTIPGRQLTVSVSWDVVLERCPSAVQLQRQLVVYPILWPFGGVRSSHHDDNITERKKGVGTTNDPALQRSNMYPITHFMTMVTARQIRSWRNAARFYQQIPRIPNRSSVRDKEIIHPTTLSREIMGRSSACKNSVTPPPLVPVTHQPQYSGDRRRHGSKERVRSGRNYF